MSEVRIKINTLGVTVKVIYYKFMSLSASGDRILFKNASTMSSSGEWAEYLVVSGRWVYFGNRTLSVQSLGGSTTQERKYPGGPVLTHSIRGYSVFVDTRFIFKSKAKMMVHMLTEGR